MKLPFLNSFGKKIAIYEAMIASVGDGLAVVDKGGKILMLNPAAAKMLKLSAQDVVGKDYIETVPAADNDGQIIPREKRSLNVVLSSGQSFTNHTANYYVRSDGTKFPGAITTSPIIFENNIIGAIITFRDITHEKEVDRMKTEFLSLASHQLRTPLSAIRWFVEILLSGDAGPLNREQREFLGNVDESTNRMVALINDLLNITRIESGRIIIDPKPTDLGKLIEGIMAEVKSKYLAKSQKIILSIHPKLDKINVDPNLVRAVYLNLINNSIKYTPAGGEITIFISRKGDSILSQVSDNGVGIPQAEQKRVFQKFFRGRNIVKKVVEGTGLGLYLVKAIIESSNGKIYFKSEENKGTTFWFTVPASGILAKKGEVSITS